MTRLRWKESPAGADEPSGGGAGRFKKRERKKCPRPDWPFRDSNKIGLKQALAFLWLCRKQNPYQTPRSAPAKYGEARFSWSSWCGSRCWALTVCHGWLKRRGCSVTRSSEEQKTHADGTTCMSVKWRKEWGSVLVKRAETSDSHSYVTSELRGQIFLLLSQAARVFASCAAPARLPSW